MDDDFHSGPAQAARWKAERLCRAVSETLSLALSGSGEEALLDVSVRDVRPLGDLSQLQVTIGIAPTADPVAVVSALGRAQGYLRGEIASAIRRKRVPGLVFRLAAPEEGVP
ncbi:MAG TPA: ribosome-binding factor A [Planctomycetota bacterium]|nr:ribosome-binding factor A [Planctomycetota bacterium]